MVNRILSLLLQLLVLQFSFFNQLVDINLSSLIDLIILSLHNSCSTMQKNLFIFFFGKVQICGLSSTLDNDLIKF